MNRSEFLINLVIGGIGAGGQGLLLSRALQSYPFKILSSPPVHFYSATGLALGFVAPILSLLALYVFRATRRPFITAIPVVACPLLFWVLFRLAFVMNPYHYPDVSPSPDFIATKATEAGFVSEVLWLTFAGLIVGTLCGLGVKVIFRCGNRASQLTMAKWKMENEPELQ